MRKRRPQPDELAHYEGLVRKTAGMYARIVEEDYEDICQILRLKVWRALNSFDPSRSKLPIERYVFSCVRNQVKDLLKKKRRDEMFIEDWGLTSLDAEGAYHGTGGNGHKDHFEARYLSVDEEAGLEGVLDDLPTIPSTLSQEERSVLALLYYGYSHAEMALRLSISRRDVGTAIREIRTKMADWKPSPDESQDISSEKPSKASKDSDGATNASSPNGNSENGSLKKTSEELVKRQVA